MEGGDALIMDGTGVNVDGLRELVAALRGPAFRDVNRELRQFSRLIAADIAPLVADAVRASPAPQAAAMAATVRPHSDRVPVVVVGKVNPRFNSGFGHKGESAAQRRMRRGSLARGVVAGPLGGRRDTPAHENYYRIPRSASWGELGRRLRSGGIITQTGADLYLRGYLSILKAHGFDVLKGR